MSKKVRTILDLLRYYMEEEISVEPITKIPPFIYGTGGEEPEITKSWADMADEAGYIRMGIDSHTSSTIESARYYQQMYNQQMHGLQQQLDRQREFYIQSSRDGMAAFSDAIREQSQHWNLNPNNSFGNINNNTGGIWQQMRDREANNDRIVSIGMALQSSQYLRNNEEEENNDSRESN